MSTTVRVKNETYESLCVRLEVGKADRESGIETMDDLVKQLLWSDELLAELIDRDPGLEAVCEEIGKEDEITKLEKALKDLKAQKSKVVKK